MIRAQRLEQMERFSRFHFPLTPSWPVVAGQFSFPEVQYISVDLVPWICFRQGLSRTTASDKHHTGLSYDVCVRVSFNPCPITPRRIMLQGSVSALSRVTTGAETWPVTVSSVGVLGWSWAMPLAGPITYIAGKRFDRGEFRARVMLGPASEFSEEVESRRVVRERHGSRKSSLPYIRYSPSIVDTMVLTNSWGRFPLVVMLGAQAVTPTPRTGLTLRSLPRSHLPRHIPQNHLSILQHTVILPQSTGNFPIQAALLPVHTSKIAHLSPPSHSSPLRACRWRGP